MSNYQTLCNVLPICGRIPGDPWVSNYLETLQGIEHRWFPDLSGSINPIHGDYQKCSHLRQNNGDGRSWVGNQNLFIRIQTGEGNQGGFLPPFATKKGNGYGHGHFDLLGNSHGSNDTYWWDVAPGRNKY
jgi:hypothetical protein